MGRRAGGNFGIQRIDSGGVNPDQHLPSGRYRTSQTTHSQRGLGGLRDGGKHAVIHDGEPCVVERLQVAVLVAFR